MKVYVHVPFCRSKCVYCDFYSTPRLELMEAYADSVVNEWLEQGGEKYVPDTIYIGGGTPSSLPLPLLDGLADAVMPRDERIRLREFTIEANPEDVTPQWASHIASQTGVGRVSMGIQTFHDPILRFLGRRHDSAKAVRAIDELRAAGISNISCDLIYGLPGQTFEMWQADLDRLISLRPEHISAYLLSYEPRTRLGVMLAKGKVEEAPDELAERMYDYLCEATRDVGYEHYEISNFALPGFRARHNSSYWDGSDYLGLGPGAHSMVAGVRWYNPSNLKLYLDHEGVGTRIIEQEDAKNRFNDMLITSLRTVDGLDPGSVPDEFAENFITTTRRLLDSGQLVQTSSGRLLIPEGKWLTSNSILLELIEI